MTCEEQFDDELSALLEAVHDIYGYDFRKYSRYRTKSGEYKWIGSLPFWTRTSPLP